MRARFTLVAALLLLATSAAGQAQVADGSMKSVEERRIVASIKQENAKLEQRKADLDRRELQLKTLEDEVDKKLAAMQELRQELVKLLNRKQQKEGLRVDELSKIYEKMDPQKAAFLIKGLDRQLAVELLLGIKKKTAGKILDNLDAQTATELSKAFTEIPVKK